MNDLVDHVSHSPAEALDTLLARRSHWPLTAPGPDDAALNIIVDAALCAPDHGRLRPWRFVLIRDEAREELGDLLVEAAAARSPDQPPEAFEARRRKALAAPTVIVLAAHVSPSSPIPEIEQLLSVGAAAMNMLNAIHLLGFGGFWATGPDAYDTRIHAALDFDADERVLGFLFIGTPAAQLKSADAPERPPASAHLREWFGRSSV